MANGVCYILASRDEDGNYVPEEAVFTDMDEAIQEACEMLDRDPTSDPRLIQVLLDPAFPNREPQVLSDIVEGEWE